MTLSLCWPCAMRCSKVCGPGTEVVPSPVGGNAEDVRAFFSGCGARFENRRNPRSCPRTWDRACAAYRRICACPKWLRFFPAAPRLPADIAARHSPRFWQTRETSRCSSKNFLPQETALRFPFPAFRESGGRASPRLDRRRRPQHIRYPVSGRVGFTPITTMFSPAAASAIPVCRSLRNCFSFWMT